MSERFGSSGDVGIGVWEIICLRLAGGEMLYDCIRLRGSIVSGIGMLLFQKPLRYLWISSENGEKSAVIIP
jgi:hypothetical protein